jgi:hypothetical protein
MFILEMLEGFFGALEDAGTRRTGDVLSRKKLPVKVTEMNANLVFAAQTCGTIRYRATQNLENVNF